MRNLLEDENMGHRLPRDGAPNKSLLKSVTAVNTMRAAQLCSTIFVREALLRPDANVIRKTIAKCNDPTVKCWMRMMSGTYPVNAYLYRIKKVKSPNCTFCDRGDRETISHFLKVCPKFHHARTAAHNRVRHALFKLLQIHASTHWNLVEETPMYLTGLRLQDVPTVEVQQAGRAVQDSQIQGGQMSLGRWQPDIVCISFAKKKIAIGPEVSLPSDSRMAALQEAHSRKTQSYGPLITALQTYVDSGWKVEILPWMVGARGMVRTELLTPTLEFLEIPKQKWTGIIEATVRASVEELAHINRIRFSTSGQNSIFDSDDPKWPYAPPENLLSVGSKRKIPKDSADLRARQIRWKQINGDQRTQHGTPDNGERRPPSSST